MQMTDNPAVREALQESLRADSGPADTDRFDLSFRILGNEIFGMTLESQSKMKSWVAN